MFYKRKKESKYKNKKVEFNGITFDSLRELKRYKELLLLERANKIKDLELQVKYTLIPKQIKNKRVVERECSYKADFKYYDNVLKCIVVEDTKGFKTNEYKIKKKLMLYVHDIEIKEI